MWEKENRFCLSQPCILMWVISSAVCRSFCITGFLVIKSIHLKKKKGYLSSNIIFIRPLLINLYVHSGATKSCHQDVLWKANGPTQRIELHVPLFTGKAGLGDNKKGDIYCSLQQCDVPRQITAQVGQAPPCWEEDESVSDARRRCIYKRERSHPCWRSATSGDALSDTADGIKHGHSHHHVSHRHLVSARLCQTPGWS